MNAVALLLNHDYPWQQFIAARNEEGANWVAEYNQPELSAIYSSIIGTFKLMGKARYDEAFAILEKARLDLEEARKTHRRSVILVHECWYYGAIAFYYYCLEDYPLAEKMLLEGQRAVTLGIEEQPVLLPAIYRCCDTWLHRARIARNQCSWSTMRHRIDQYHAIVRGDQPYCTLSDGKSVFAADLEAYLSELELDPELQQYVDAFCDRENQTGLFKVFAQKAYVLPWLPIQY